MAPAVVQHPVDDVAAGAVVGDQLLLGVEAGLGGGDPELLLIGVGRQFGRGEGQIQSQTGTAATAGEQDPLDADVAVVVTGISQQGHVLTSAIKLEAGQLMADVVVQQTVAFRQRGLDLHLLILQQLMGQRAAEQLTDGQTGQQGQAEQQQAEPEGRWVARCTCLMCGWDAYGWHHHSALAESI